MSLWNNLHVSLTFFVTEVCEIACCNFLNVVFVTDASVSLFVFFGFKYMKKGRKQECG